MDGAVEEEITSRIAKARAAFSKLRYLWSSNDIQCHVRGKIHSAMVNNDEARHRVLSVHCRPLLSSP